MRNRQADMFNEPPPPQTAHTLYFDGSCDPNPGQMAIGWHIDDAHGDEIMRGAAEIGWGTNNVAEWRAAIAVMTEAHRLGIQDVIIKGDSRIVIMPLQGRGKPIHKRAPHIQPFLEEAVKLRDRFRFFKAEWIPREENTRADSLSIGQGIQ